MTPGCLYDGVYVLGVGESGVPTLGEFQSSPVHVCADADASVGMDSYEKTGADISHGIFW